MASQQTEPAQDADLHSARLPQHTCRGPKREQYAIHVQGQGAGKLERVTFASTKQPAGSERRRDDMNDPHVLTVSLVTLGDPRTMTGGYLYHRRIADMAPTFDAQVGFASFPTWPFPLPALAGAALLRSVGRQRSDVVLLDSIAAAFLGPWLWRRRLSVPLVGILHQPPGGIDHGRTRKRVQAALDRRAYRHAARLLVASADLGEQMRRLGVPDSLLRVVPPGRDVAAEAVVP